MKDDDLARFVRSHQAGLWRFLRLCGCDGLEAEEIAQEALLIALQKGRTGTDAAPFLRQTAKFLWLRARRDDRRRAEHHAAAVERALQRDLAQDDGAGWFAALDACLDALPARSRFALERTYRDGLGRRELGDELGIGEHGVRTLLQRLRAGLRECIERRLGRRREQ